MKNVTKGNSNYPAVLDAYGNLFFPSQRPMGYYFNPMTPLSKEEFYSWIEAIGAVFNSKKNITDFLKRLLKGGSVSSDGKNFSNGIIIVYFDPLYFQNLILPSGRWEDSMGCYYGINLWNLCCYVNSSDMRSTMSMIADYAKEHNLYNKGKSKDSYKQVRVPPSRDFFSVFNFLDGNLVHTSNYYTSYLFLFQVVQFWQFPSMDIIPVYYTLWEHVSLGENHVKIFFPQKPYCLYNLNQLPKKTDKFYFSNIVFVSNEWEADKLTNLLLPTYNFDLIDSPDINIGVCKEPDNFANLVHPTYNVDLNDFPDVGIELDEILSGKKPELKTPHFVFTTCFMGFAGIKDADLSPLEGRDVYLYLPENSPDVQHLPEAIKSLKKARCSKIHVKIGNHKFVEADEYLRSKGHGGEAQGLIGDASNIIQEGQEFDPEENDARLLIDPIIEEGDIVWIFGAAKAYKSWFGYSLAYALSKGNQVIAKWKTADPLKVLYIDGEMKNQSAAKKRIKRILSIKEGKIYWPFTLYLRSSNTVTDILSEEWQNKETNKKMIADRDVIILDNFVSLTSNTQKAVSKALDWFRRLRKDGKTVIVLDHSNREGDVQGSIDKERTADLVIRIELDNAVQKRVKISFPHARSLSPEDSVPFDLDMIFTEDAFGMEVVDAPIKEDLLTDKQLMAAVAQDLKEQGYEKETIEKVLGIKQSTFYNYLKEELPSLTETQKKQVGEKKKEFLEKWQKAVENDVEPAEK